jgi:hypothetical protein
MALDSRTKLQRVLIYNLKQAAEAHKQACGENCNVSLALLRMAAEEIGEGSADAVIKSLLNEQPWPL